MLRDTGLVAARYGDTEVDQHTPVSDALCRRARIQRCCTYTQYTDSHALDVHEFEFALFSFLFSLCCCWCSWNHWRLGRLRTSRLIKVANGGIHQTNDKMLCLYSGNTFARHCQSAPFLLCWCIRVWPLPSYGWIKQLSNTYHWCKQVFRYCWWMEWYRLGVFGFV